MSQLPEKRNKRFADPAIGVEEDERTVEMDRTTFDEGPPKATDDSTVRDTEGTRNTEIYRNDYETALPAYYRLIRMIGRGGMSEVFLAEDERLGRHVAIKFLNSEFRRDPDRMRRFNREARAASALNHPHILTIHDIGENDGVQYIVSEFVDGETLGSRIGKGKLPLAEAVRISIQIASALSASHNAGIVHRDIKPDNVMIRRDGSVKVLDFGLAKETGGIVFNSNGEEARTLETAPTSPGLILGTPQYMSPEQARGKPLDARTDIFSFGVILFEMATGKQPFPGTSMVDIIAAVIGNDPLPIKKFLDDPPELLVRIVEKALRKNKDERYATMEHLLSDLRDLQREVADDPFIDRSTLGDNARDTRPNTIRTFFVESPIRRNFVLLFLIGIPLLAAAWWLSSGRTGSEPTASAGSMRMVPITTWNSSTGELVAAASFAPDAKMIAFAATKTGATEIWVKPVEGGEPIQITRNGFYNQYPVWSPNGQSIAFFSSRNGNNGIWRTSFTGGEQTQIASGVGPSARPLLWAGSGKIYFQEGSEVFAIMDRTGERAQITDFARKGVTPRNIELSPNEKTLAYSIREQGVWKVYIAGVNGDQGSEIASSAEQIDDLAWDPDGASVIYSASSEGAYQVFRSGAGYAKPVQISNGNLDFFVHDISGDGSKILYGSVSETSDLWSVNVADGRQTPLANEVATEFWPDVSPDGNSIVYQAVSQADRPYRGSLKAKALDGSSGAVGLSPEGFAPVYSPDGQWVAFFRRSDSGISIWRVRTGGGDALKLADGNVSPPSYLATPYLKIGISHIGWSPDNNSLVYSAKNEGVTNIWIVAADGAKNAILSNNKEPAENFCCPAWSPDGRSILFVSEYSQTSTPPKRMYRLWSIDPTNSAQKMIFESSEQMRFIGFANGGAEAVVVNRNNAKNLAAVAESVQVRIVNLRSGSVSDGPLLQNVYMNNIHLSPDGKTIAFVSRQDERSALFALPIRAGTPKQLIVETDPKILYSTLEWSPDGRSIVFGKQTRTNLISMLSN